MRTSKLLALLTLGLVLIAGCGTPAPGPNGSSGSGATSAPAPAGEVSVDDFVSQITKAQADVKTYTMDLTMQAASDGKPTTMKLTGQVDQTDPKHRNMKMETDFAGTKMTLLVVDGISYIQMPSLGGKWMQVPESQQSPNTPESSDPTASFVKAKGSIKKIAYIGDEDVDGTKTKHYQVTMDAKALGQVTGNGDAKLSGDTFEYGVWMDDAGLIRRMSINTNASFGDTMMPFVMDAKFSGINQPVDIKAPSKDQLIQMGG